MILWYCCEIVEVHKTCQVLFIGSPGKSLVLKFQSSRVLAGEYIWHRSMALFAFFGGGRDTTAWHLVAGKSQGWKGG